MNRDEWSIGRYRIFNEKIDSFQEHEKYAWLRKYADDAMVWNSGFGYFQIKAEDFIARIEKAPLTYIRDWLDGKNKLEWAGIQAHEESVSGLSAPKNEEGLL